MIRKENINIDFRSYFIKIKNSRSNEFSYFVDDFWGGGSIEILSEVLSLMLNTDSVIHSIYF